MHVQKSRELSIKLGDAVGIGATLFGQLKAAGVNLIATCSYQIGGEAFFSLVPEDLAGAEEVLREGSYAPVTCDVLLVEMPNKSGSLADLLRQVAEAGIGVSSAYVTTGGKNRALAVLKTQNNDKVLEILTASSHP